MNKQLLLSLTLAALIVPHAQGMETRSVLVIEGLEETDETVVKIVNDPEIAKITNEIKTIRINKTNITDAALEALAKDYPCLKTIVVTCCPLVTISIKEKFAKLYPAITIHLYSREKEEAEESVRKLHESLGAYYSGSKAIHDMSSPGSSSKSNTEESVRSLHESLGAYYSGSKAIQDISSPDNSSKPSGKTEQ